MSLPHPPGALGAPPAPRTVPMPATPGTPLEPLRSGRRLDRRHWLLAGLLGIVGGAIVFQQAQGSLVQLLGQPERYGWEVVSHQVGIVAFGLLAVVVAFLMAPAGAGRRILAIVVVLVAVAGALALQQWTFFGSGVPTWSRYVVSGPSLVVLGGVVGWILASGARWWAWFAVLLVPGIAALPMLLVRESITSGLVSWSVSLVALVIALVTLLLTLPVRR